MKTLISHYSVTGNLKSLLCCSLIRGQLIGTRDQETCQGPLSPTLLILNPVKGPRNLAGGLSSGGRWSNPQSLWAEVTAKKGNKCPSPAPQLCFHRPNDGTE